MSINIPAVLVANLMGLMILFIIFIGNKWQTSMIFKQNKALKWMFIISTVLCIADPVCSIADGKEGAFSFLLVYVGNLTIYIGNLLTATMFCKLIMERMHIKISIYHKLSLGLFVLPNIILLLLNFFLPVVFTVDSNNVYQREDYYWILNIFYVVVILYGIGIYGYEKTKGINIRFFPVWAFIVPASTGFIIQAFVYGVSTVMPFTTVSLVCIFINLQNEFIYKDKLTGLYNRFYLEIINKQIANKKASFSAMMLDLNGFKAINDTYGHDEGDRALVIFSNILTKVVSSNGIVVRYAGDEFMIFFKTHEESFVTNLINQIQQELNSVNEKYNVLYKLSASFGFDKITDEYTSVDKFIDKIDKLMYKNKNEYYESQRDGE